MSPRWEPDPDIRRGRSVIHHLHAHLVFVTKYRRGAFTDEILSRYEQIMHGCARVSARNCASSTATPTMCPCSCTTHPTWPCPGRSTPSKACPRGGCVNSSPHTSANTHRASISGHRRTSQGPAAAPPVDHQGLHRTAGVNRASADRSFGEQPASRLGHLGLTV